MELAADCSRCVALCCVALPFARSVEFAFDKAADEPCRHLNGSFGCSIHDRLRVDGMAGCATYDCYGAGQRAVELVPAHDRSAAAARVRRDAFGVLRTLHELAWLVREAVRLEGVAPVAADLDRVAASVRRASGGDPPALRSVDVAALRDDVNGVLVAAADLARAAAGPLGPDHRHHDLSGADLRGADLARSRLRGARLVGTDLRGADLRHADLTGADLRGARLAGADLRGAMFVTPAQLEAASGDDATRLPADRTAPVHWRPGGVDPTPLRSVP